MPSICPKCHQVIDDDSVCCAEVTYTWKCRDCGKVTRGFVVPYGRCFMCGGKNELIEDYAGDRAEQVAAVHEAVEYEIAMYQFYRLAWDRAREPQLRSVMEELCLKEQDHLGELEARYHLHLDRNTMDMPAGADARLAAWIFDGIDFEDETAHVLQVYDRALTMERRTRDHFRARAEALPPGPDRETFRELSAEEAEHVSLLETERAQFVG